MNKSLILPVLLIACGLAALTLESCKGAAGPAGPPGASAPAPAPYCTSPTVRGVATPGTGTRSSSGILVANPVTLAGPVNAVSIATNISSGPVSGQVRLGIYRDNAHVPTTLVLQTAPQDVVVGWNTCAIPGVRLTAGTYWMVYLLSDATITTVSGSGGDEVWAMYAWAELPPAFPTGTATTVRDDISLTTCP